MDRETRQVPINTGVAGKHDHFLDCIERGDRPVNDIDDAVETLRACLAFNRSAQSGRVETTDGPA